MQRPERGECADDYFDYIDLVPEGHVLDTLEQQANATADLLDEINEETAEHRYAPGKWSIKEVVGHVIDAERVFAARAHWFARENAEPLPPMDQDHFLTHGHFGERSLASLADEFRVTRMATVSMFRGFSDRVDMLQGTASGVQFTVRTMPWIIAGHELHHAAVLREKYL